MALNKLTINGEVVFEAKSDFDKKLMKTVTRWKKLKPHLKNCDIVHEDIQFVDQFVSCLYKLHDLKKNPIKLSSFVNELKRNSDV